jgi:hypothetical protein
LDRDGGRIPALDLFAPRPHARRTQRRVAEIDGPLGGDVDWSGYEDVRANLWHRQLHIFLHPFYYVEYGIAQLGALQVWANSKRDKVHALRAYQRALALGGSRPLPELFAAAGCRFAFDAETVKPLASAGGERIGETGLNQEAQFSRKNSEEASRKVRKVAKARNTPRVSWKNYRNFKSWFPLRPLRTLREAVLPESIASEHQPVVLVQHRIELRPARFVHAVERVKIERHDLARIFSQEQINRAAKFCVVDLGREILDHAFVVFDFERIEKISEQGRLCFHQPAAQNVSCDHGHVGTAQRPDHRAMALGAWLTFKEHGPEFSRLALSRATPRDTRSRSLACKSSTI